jgi:hypothetical protein
MSVNMDPIQVSRARYDPLGKTPAFLATLCIVLNGTTFMIGCGEIVGYIRYRNDSDCASNRPINSVDWLLSNGIIDIGLSTTMLSIHMLELFYRKTAWMSGFLYILRSFCVVVYLCSVTWIAMGGVIFWSYTNDCGPESLNIAITTVLILRMLYTLLFPITLYSSFQSVV